MEWEIHSNLFSFWPQQIGLGTWTKPFAADLRKGSVTIPSTIDIPLPGKEGRKKMFEINLRELTVSTKISWDKLIELTKGYSGADICNICRDAAYMPMRRKLMQVGGIAKISELSQSELMGE